jgi:hypothetical protein
MRARRLEGAIAASSSSEIMGTEVPGVGRADASPRRIRRLMLALALVVLAFAALYPYMDATGSCGDPGCLKFSHAHSAAPAELPIGALVTVLATVPALAGSVRLRPASGRKPAAVYLARDPETPRPSLIVGLFGAPSSATTPAVVPNAYRTSLERYWFCKW